MQILQLYIFSPPLSHYFLESQGYILFIFTTLDHQKHGARYTLVFSKCLNFSSSEICSQTWCFLFCNLVVKSCGVELHGFDAGSGTLTSINLCSTKLPYSHLPTKNTNSNSIEDFWWEFHTKIYAKCTAQCEHILHFQLLLAVKMMFT
jgi:hypothetical protein